MLSMAGTSAAGAPYKIKGPGIGFVILTLPIPGFLVGQVGGEPTMVKPADLQSAAIAARCLKSMAERAEFESDTHRVRLA